MTNKINTVLKAITYQMAGALLSDMIKNPKLNVNTTTLVLSARSYPTEDPQCSTHIYGSTITIHLKQQSDPEDTNTISYNEEQRDTPQLERKDTAVVDNLRPNRDGEGIEWLDVEEPLDLVDTCDGIDFDNDIPPFVKNDINEFEMGASNSRVVYNDGRVYNVGRFGFNKKKKFGSSSTGHVKMRGGKTKDGRLFPQYKGTQQSQVSGVGGL
nr:hypothetical protein CTI12_AA269990 [Tanacetum cinerariifolium]